MIVHYQGEARDGGVRVGRHIDVGAVAEFVERRFHNDWRWLVVVATSDGERLGEVFFDASQGRRTWWAEGCSHAHVTGDPGDGLCHDCGKADGAMITYVGIDKRGSARTGRGPMDPAEFTETVFGLGWRELTVKSAETDDVVGAIIRNVTGKRIWWAV